MNPLSNDELISAYLDGELSSEEQQRAERLLADDAESRQLLDELRSLRAGMESLPRHQLDEEFASRVLDQAERSMIAGDFPASDAETGTEGHETEKATFVPTPFEPTDHGLADHRMSRDRLIRMIAWPAIAIAAAVMIMVLVPPESKDVAMHEPAVPAESATSAEVAKSAEVADETAAEITEEMPVATGTATTEARSRGRHVFETEQDNLFGEQGAAEDGDPFGDQGNENPFDKETKSPPASQVKSPEVADVVPVPAKPSSGLRGAPSNTRSRSGYRNAEELAPPLSQEASSSDGLGNEQDRTLERDSRLKKSLSRDASRDEKLRRIDAVAVLNVAMPVGRDKETSLRSVWSRHQLVAMALPAMQGRELAEKTKESSARSGRGPGASRAGKSASAGKAKKQAARIPDRVFVVEGTETQVRAALAELSGQSGGYRFRYGSVELAENEPAPDDEEVAAGTEEDDEEFDAADFSPAAEELQETVEAQKSDAPAPEAKEEPKSDDDVDDGTDGEKLRRGQTGQQKAEEEANEAPAQAAGGRLEKGGRTKGGIGGKERRIRVMVVFRTAKKDPDSTPAEEPAVPADTADE